MIYAIEIIFKSHEPFQSYQLTGPANSASKAGSASKIVYCLAPETYSGTMIEIF